MNFQEFKGIWIPKEICNLKDLGWTEKLLLSEAYTLSSQKECYATNEHFSILLGITKESVSRVISKLIKLGYLNSKIRYKENTKQVERRTLKVNWKFVLNQNDNTYTPNCNYSPLKNDIYLPTKMLKKENSREKSKEYNNTYAQSGVQIGNRVQDETTLEKFERFYNAYPKKKSKGKALNWFKKHRPESSLVDTMLESLEKQKLTINWQKQNGRYIPYPATWLNARGWENEVSPWEMIDLSENSVSRFLAMKLYETVKNVPFTLTTDTEKLIISWTIEIEKYLSLERTKEREDRIFYAINLVKNSEKWRKIIVDARSLIKNIDFIRK